MDQLLGAGHRVKTYTSIQELSRDSAAIVVAKATDNHSEDSDQGIPLTITIVTIQATLKGQVPPQ